MNRPDLVRRISEVLRENNIKKKVSGYRQIFHISDDEGNTKDFKIKKPDRSIIYTAEDIGAILDACAFVIAEAIRSGDVVNWRGLGKFSLKYRKPRTTTLKGQPVVVAGRFVPKYSPSFDIKTAASIYASTIADRLDTDSLPIFNNTDTNNAEDEEEASDEELIEEEVLDDCDEEGDDE